MRRMLALLLAVLALLPAACRPAEKDSAPEASPTPEIVSIDEGWEDSVAQEGTPLPRPGDTLDTWDLSRAEGFPADDDCTAEELLTKWMAVEGITADDLLARKCSQLVLAAAKDGHPHITTTVCYEKQPDGSFLAVDSLGRMLGSCGESGVNHDRTQGDMSSPGGLWKLGTAFGNEAKPEGLLMPWRDITPYSDWVGDNDSMYYNTWQELNDPNLKDAWSDCEHLEDYTSSYALACVIRFNMPPYAEKNKGSAIFFHCSTGSTAGCIGLGHIYFERVLKWLDPAKNPHILITGYGK